MRWGGVLLLVFIVFHILHFTIGTIPSHRAEFDSAVTDVYGNVVASFRIWWVALFYIVAMVALGLHLFHGAWSSVRTLGLSEAVAQSAARGASRWCSPSLVWLGFTVVPVAVLAFVG